ncbi:MAG TPA: response regulator transcription factor [Leptolyngbyaceae cyanobacterium M33_DOE_097]|uniref:Response regulator transcription factor n=1 Tax=Oscillatoriales cyanobacterium SpSt-418 TaxID=2282169 RepID=A0A7C3KGX1_9CYAN|nr:response regulator transcription factor [Leptolyngbyaceae cyanobacterium M33_DOE_097]
MTKTPIIYFSERELEVLQLIVEGYHNSQIATTLLISEGTVKCHIRSIFGKAKVNDRTQAAVFALRNNLAK